MKEIQNATITLDPVMAHAVQVALDALINNAMHTRTQITQQIMAQMQSDSAPPEIPPEASSP